MHNTCPGVWETVDSLKHYTTALRSVRPEDYSGHVMEAALHQMRFFAGLVIAYPSSLVQW